MPYGDAIDQEFNRATEEWRNVLAAATQYDWWDVLILPLGVLDGILRGDKAETFIQAARQITDRYKTFTDAGREADRQLELENLRRVVAGARRELLDDAGESNADVGANVERAAGAAGEYVDDLANKAALGAGLGLVLLVVFVAWRFTR